MITFVSSFFAPLMKLMTGQSESATEQLPAATYSLGAGACA
jgi:hypothetical protein